MDIILEEMEKLGADGVDFTSYNACLRDEKFIGEIYESMTLEEFKICDSYPRSQHLYWNGTKENKEYINIKRITTYKFVDVIKFLEEGKTVSSPFIAYSMLKLVTVNIGNEQKKIFVRIWYEEQSRTFIERTEVYSMPTEILFSEGWEIVE